MNSQQGYQAMNTLRKEVKSREASLNEGFDRINNLPTLDGNADAAMNACVQTLQVLAEEYVDVDEDEQDEEDILILVCCIIAIYCVLQSREQERIKKQDGITREERWNTQKKKRLVRLRARHKIRLHRIRDMQTKQLVGQPLQDRSIREAEDAAAITTEVS